MNHVESKVRCEDCAEWLRVDAETETATCDCGRRYVLTVSEIPRVPAN